ncbi:LOW QUALITY PROTEIN: tRNA-splicing endonuclease subunit Sen2 [Megalobrama amblycephala]|uniref:LOW QUALITY PROTEIN: tRNA-splicing endonuclease subunit Sen2 n=1 Tax=Megalobrama amblycephala TaxID=75352 RepID=UPI00201447EC|nr:LOW QUALITY PROTEIN: tRNA-splicing endonuclease subunit Sen2 [Megalobrama amblycephala]
MTEAVFQAPKRRAKVYECFRSALPVCWSAEEDQRIFRAEIISHRVIVSNPAHIHTLYERGYFGKGVFSRSRPEHVISKQLKYVGDRCLPVISSSEYQKRLSWARAALVMQGLDDESVNHALQILTKPVELDVKEEQSQEPMKSQDDSIGGSLDDVSCEADLNLDQTDTAVPQRQGNPLHDPLAELCAQEPERLDQLSKPSVKCRRHDDWIAHCGCRPDESQLSSERIVPSAEPSEPCEYVLVEVSEDDDDNRNSTEGSFSMDQREKLVCRINPFTMMEYLQLSYEEAFFLVYALGCLSVYYSGEPLSVAQVWTMFRSLQPNFSTSYTAYHYFRSKGWVPKSGIKYGTDLMLYRKGPPFYHASYSVVVERADACFRGATLRPFSWRSLAALSRTTGNVSKELMLCYVITPSNLTEDMLSSPDCLKRFTVQEVLVSRWVSSRERTEQEEV